MVLSIFVFGISPAIANDLYSPQRVQENKHFAMKFSLGGGAAIAPSYEGASTYTTSPVIDFDLEYLRIGDSFEIGGDDNNQGLSIAPSFNFINERVSQDHTALNGLPNVDAAFELGGTVAYQYQNIRAFADVRYGVVGHNDIVGELGIDVTLKPTNQLTLTIGPRATAAGEKYMTTYFGVSNAAAASSNLSAFDATAGIKSVGLQATAQYDFGNEWALKGTAGWNRLVGSAANSPITTGGSPDQFTAQIGLTKAFSIDF